MTMNHLVAPKKVYISVRRSPNMAVAEGTLTVSDRKGWTIASCSRRQWVWMVAMIAISGIVKGGWGQVRFITEAIFGPFATTILGGFFIFWGMLAVFSIKKFGAGTLVMTLGTIFELAAGNPFGQMVWVYNFFEGLGADIGFAIFRYKFSSNRTANLVKAGIVGAVDDAVAYLVFGFTLNIFALSFIANLITFVTGAIVAVFWGMFAFGIYGTLQRVNAVPPDQ